VIVHLVRHGTHRDLGKKLTGRARCPELDEQGQRQAERLAQHFANLEVGLIQASPRGRAVATARPIAETRQLACHVVSALDELDFGEWSGIEFSDLQNDPRWIQWNVRRGGSRPPGGETMDDGCRRIMTHIDTLHRQRFSGRAVLVTHAEIIRAVVLHMLGRSMDAWNTVEIAPASVSTVVVSEQGPKLTKINEEIL
jgi:broad specificity phosphatase PhoE